MGLNTVQGTVNRPWMLLKNRTTDLICLHESWFNISDDISPAWYVTIEIVVYNGFLQKLVRQCRTDMTSFCMQFEKRDVGYCRRLFLLAEKEGGKEKLLALIDWEKKLFSNEQKATFQFESSTKIGEMTSHRCVVTWPVSAKKTNVYYWDWVGSR